MLATSTMLTLAAGATLLVAIIILLVGVVGAQRGQKAVYYAARRESQRVASRLYSWALWCVGLAVALFLAGRWLPVEDLRTADELVPPTPALLSETPTAENATLSGAAAAPTESPGTLPTDSASPMPPTPTASIAVLTSTAQPAPTQAPPAQVATPTLAPEIIEITPLGPTTAPTTTAPAAPAAPAATAPISAGTALSQPIVITVVSSGKPLTFRAVSTELDGNGSPIHPSTQFSSGVATIYVVFDFQDIPRGTVLRHTWLRNGVSVSFSSAPFTKLGLGTESISWTPKGGFTPGLYEVRVALANTPQFTANFLVK